MPLALVAVVVPVLLEFSTWSTCGHGGIGVQLPPAFRDPAQTIGAPGPGSTKYWVAGGGGGGYYAGFGGAWDGSSLQPGGPYAGAGGNSIKW